MSASIPLKRFHPLSITAHWATVLLLIAVYALIELREIYPKGSELRDLMKTWHFMLGFCVWGLVALRLGLRAVYPAPVISPPPPTWQQWLARGMHLTLYAFLIVMPLLGWLALSAKGKPIPFFGFELPALLPPDKGLGKSLEDVHEALGEAGYYLIGLHALAALWHHYFMHDDSLRHMLPGRRVPVLPSGTTGA